MSFLVWRVRVKITKEIFFLYNWQLCTLRYLDIVSVALGILHATLCKLVDEDLSNPISRFVMHTILALLPVMNNDSILYNSVA